MAWTTPTLGRRARARGGPVAGGCIVAGEVRTVTRTVTTHRLIPGQMICLRPRVRMLGGGGGKRGGGKGRGGAVALEWRVSIWEMSMPNTRVRGICARGWRSWRHCAPSAARLRRSADLVPAKVNMRRLNLSEPLSLCNTVGLTGSRGLLLGARRARHEVGERKEKSCQRMKGARQGLAALIRRLILGKRRLTQAD